jgi:hypothetical protein
VNDDNIEKLNNWLTHLKHGLVLSLVGHVITWIWLIILIILVLKK